MLMIKTDELRGIIVANKHSMKSIAELIGITPAAFYKKMKRGIFNSDEIEIMIKELKIKDPIEIFFAQ